MEVTNDLTKFGYRELAIAGELLKAYGDNGSDFLYDGVQVWFNANSGYVFLSDSDFNVGVMEDGKVVQFFTCPECGYEGTQSDAIADDHDFIMNGGYCSIECYKKNNSCLHNFNDGICSTCGEVKEVSNE